MSSSKTHQDGHPCPTGSHKATTERPEPETSCNDVQRLASPWGFSPVGVEIVSGNQVQPANKILVDKLLWARVVRALCVAAGKVTPSVFSFTNHEDVRQFCAQLCDEIAQGGGAL